MAAAGAENPVFATTRWTVVLAAGGGGESDAAREALEQLCRCYWYPLYAYVRRRGYDAHSAQDLTQGFFARLLERNDLAGLRREGGRFRSSLLTVLNHYLANEHQRATAQKRGGGRPLISLDDDEAEDRYRREPAHQESPDRLFERRWALALLEEAMARLEAEQGSGPKAATFRVLKGYLSHDPEAGEYPRLAAELGIAPGTLAVAVHRLRARYRELVRAAVVDTVEGPLEAEAELRHLQSVLTEG